MSFDQEPEDPHGEYIHEIELLQAELALRVDHGEKLRSLQLRYRASIGTNVRLNLELSEASVDVARMDWIAQHCELVLSEKGTPENKERNKAGLRRVVDGMRGTTSW